MGGSSCASTRMRISESFPLNLSSFQNTFEKSCGVTPTLSGHEKPLRRDCQELIAIDTIEYRISIIPPFHLPKFQTQKTYLNRYPAFNNDLLPYNWKRLCPQYCIKAQTLFTKLQENISLPLLKARCSPRSVDWTTAPKIRFVATIVPDISWRPAAKRRLEIGEDGVNGKKKHVIRKGVKRDTGDLFRLFTGV